MTTTRRRCAAAFVAIMAWGLVAVPGAAIDMLPDASFGVDSVVVDPGPFVLDGTQTATAAISVTLHDVVGVRDRCVNTVPVLDSLWPEYGVGVRLMKISADPHETVLVRLSPSSGSPTAGTWSGQWRMASTRSGTWVVTEVQWCAHTVDDPAWGDEALRMIDPRAPGSIAAITVVGTHVPSVTRRAVPAVVAWNAPQSVELTVRDGQGRPWAGRRLVVGLAAGTSRTNIDPCLSTSGRTTVAADATGRVTLPLVPEGPLAFPGGFGTGGVCVELTEPDGADPLKDPDVTVLGTWHTVPELAPDGLERVERYQSVGLSAPRGPGRAVTFRSRVVTWFSVSGLSPSLPLQRRTRQGWRTVAIMAVTGGGAHRGIGYTSFAARVRAPAGTSSWRVLAPPGSHLNRRLVPTPSPVVVVTF